MMVSISNFEFEQFSETAENNDAQVADRKQTLTSCYQNVFIAS